MAVHFINIGTRLEGAGFVTCLPQQLYFQRMSSLYPWDGTLSGLQNGCRRLGEDKRAGIVRIT